MTIDAARFQKLLNDFKLEQLFNEFGWDHASLKPQEIPVSGETFTLTAIAQKRGVAVFRCSPDGSGNIPPRPTLLKIEKEATKLAHEHLLVFADAAQTALTWLWVARVVERNIANHEIREAGARAVIIEDYPADKYGPSPVGWARLHLPTRTFAHQTAWANNETIYPPYQANLDVERVAVK